MAEVWKDMQGYEGLYQISNLGRIKSLSKKVKNKNGYRTTKEKIMKNILSNNGYLQTTLRKGKRPKSFLIHRLVAEAFIPNPNKYKCVNHKDENKLNNNVNNLEWCTREYNNNYGTHNKKVKETKQKKYGKAVKQITLDGKIIETFSCIREAHRKTNVGRKEITNVCLKKYKQAGGYRWEYV